MRTLCLLIFALTLSTGASAQVQSGGFDPDLFERWISMRVGDGEPVYWYSTGTVRSYPAGETLATVEGYDAAQLGPRAKGDPIAHQYSRKTYIYHDAKTGERLREVDGKPLPPIQYPYQYITYRLDGDQIETMVEQGRAPNVQQIGPGRDISGRWMGGGVAQFTAPVYLDFPLPNGGRYEAFENYDFFVQPDAVDRKARYQLSWVRYGSLPPFADGKPVIMHMVAWRYDSFDDVPESMKAYVTEEAPMWKLPPLNADEIASLQAPE